ncbi:peroxidase family protein [Phreatobacter sp. AB_2022a]|uniref:peroxidase family protein n=1 Tax=Phreatobacter sp. AB_2022a TaxID=3003134 RepID=UPI0022874463|nr:peroxidase family protein [Phreatobacter sp. AB_2022a]MCZ0735968.1 hypothetical protein [Phreatobacter sp. AB_2022a]
MGQHGNNLPFRRAQPPGVATSAGFAMAERVAAPAAPPAAPPPAADDYVSLIGASDLRDADDSRRLMQDFPAVEDQCQLIANIGARMLDWNVPSATAPVRPIDSRTAPAGYTYLGQFIAHDISFAAERFPHQGGGASAESLDNLRSASLRLETIYGGGPKYFPLAYACPVGAGGADPWRTERTHLRLGLTRSSGGPQAPDLPRLACPVLNGLDGAPAEAERGATDVLVPDGRNDDHALISQLTTLFMRSHNRIADAVLQSASHAGEAMTELDYHQVFERARAANVHIYRTIVWNDYLRRMLDPDVFARYAPDAGRTDGAIRLVTAAPVLRMPVEFSHAAFRFGHAMVRPSYRLGLLRPFELDDILRHSSSNEPDLMPFDESWLIDWNRFFGGQPGDSPAEFMFSRPLGPTITPMGPDTTFVAAGPDGLDRALPIAVTKSGQTGPATGMATRDLARAYSVPMASVAAILAVMKRDEALRRIIERHRLLASAEHRAQAVRRWLDAAGMAGQPKDVAFSEAQADFLTRNPPLFFFVLFEAEQIGGGLRLGPLGSFIVAETLFARLVADATATAVEAGRRYSPRGLTSPPKVVDRDIRAAFGGTLPATMQDLIRHLGP